MNGCWPKVKDIEFRDFAINNVFPIIREHSGFVKELANTLLEKQHIFEDEIKTIAKKYMVIK